MDNVTINDDDVDVESSRVESSVSNAVWFSISVPDFPQQINAHAVAVGIYVCVCVCIYIHVCVRMCQT